MASMEEYQQRLDVLVPLADSLERDQHALSTRLDRTDQRVLAAEQARVYIPEPLTIGTLTTSVLEAIESVKLGMRDVERAMHPGEHP